MAVYLAASSRCAKMTICLVKSNKYGSGVWDWLFDLDKTANLFLLIFKAEPFLTVTLCHALD